MTSRRRLGPARPRTPERARWVRVGNPGSTTDEQCGTALVELVWLCLGLLVPLVYVLITLVGVQRGAYGATEAARAAGRAYVLAPSPAVGRARAYAAARVAMADQGLPLPRQDLVISCQPTPESCLRPRSRVRITIAFQARLPLLPSFFGHLPASVRVTASHVEPFGTFRDGAGS